MPSAVVRPTAEISSNLLASIETLESVSIRLETVLCMLGAPVPDGIARNPHADVPREPLPGKATFLEHMNGLQRRLQLVVNQLSTLTSGAETL